MAMQKRSNGQLPTEGSAGDFMIRALRAHPEGVQRAKMPDAMREAGYANPPGLNSISTLISTFPHVFRTNGTGLYRLHPRMVHPLALNGNGHSIPEQVLTQAQQTVASIAAESPMSPEERDTHLAYAVRSNAVLRQCVLMLLSATDVMPTPIMAGVRE